MNEKLKTAKDITLILGIPITMVVMAVLAACVLFVLMLLGVEWIFSPNPELLRP